MTIGIYIWENQINYKKYVGQSLNVERRKKYYLNGSFPNEHIKSAFKKYGIDNFSFSVFTCEENELNKMEYEFVRDMKTTDREYGYNKKDGGANGKPNEVTKKRMSVGQKNRKPITEETRKKMSDAAKARKPITEETRNKLSEARKGRKMSEEAIIKTKMFNTGKKRSEESRKKMSESRKGKKLSDEIKKKISDGCKGNTNCLGYKHSYETRRKMSASQKLRNKENK
jgi:group I intron endonuclease